jgi:hypothetical protein
MLWDVEAVELPCVSLRFEFGPPDQLVIFLLDPMYRFRIANMKLDPIARLIITVGKSVGTFLTSILAGLRTR